MRSWFLSLMVLLQVAAAAEQVVKMETQWPPAGTAVVKVFAMSGGPDDRIVMDGKLHPTAKPAEGVALTEEQVRQLSAAMRLEQKMRLSFLCFEPADAVVFYDKGGNILASVSVCFTCYGARIEPESLEKRLDYGAMADFFASLKLDGGYDFGKKGVDAYKVKYRQVLEEVREKREKKEAAKRAVAIDLAKENLRKMGIDPEGKTVRISEVLEGEAYFRNRPKNEHWDMGRKAVGNASFYLVTFTDPGMPRGGIHQYFFEAETHRWLWVTRGK